ncbi:MAG: PTS sugar transporter subunit IIC, partial [Erysipelotrichaceae bacterium]
MNEISIVQILLLTAYGFIAIWDDLNPGFKLGKPVVAGMFAGLIMGDIATGLLVGGTLQLMILGVG